MPEHHFTTPRVVYVGPAYGTKSIRKSGSAVRAGVGMPRRDRDRFAQRRPEPTAPTAIR
jgi:hypothetical protein